jgi:CRP/FNR family cyclic AMP-dependent transcriptional regulator
MNRVAGQEIHPMPTDIIPSDEADSLSRIPLFKRLTPEELEQLAREVDQVKFDAEEIIFNERDKGDALYVVESGSVRIWVLDEDVKPVTLKELEPGEFFGELAVLDRGPRSTNATAITEATLHRLSSDDFQAFLMQHPDVAIDVICEIGARMRQTNALVSQRASRNINVEMEERATIGQRIADRVASFGGSWTFIMIYVGFLLGWIALNTFILVHHGSGNEGAQFDPYPYILLNLMLSMTAALQAPIIMMSQNRAAEKDRLAAEQDFQVNLKSELMLEELMRKSRGRDDQIEKIAAAVIRTERGPGSPAGQPRWGGGSAGS